MTDNEIIKALECHKERELETCANCPLLNIDGCAYELCEHALSLINRQKAEIERLSNSAKQWEDTAKDLFVSRENDKAEAIKEFEDKIKDQFDRYGVDYTVYAIVDDVAKEVVGDDK